MLSCQAGLLGPPCPAVLDPATVRGPPMSMSLATAKRAAARGPLRPQSASPPHGRETRRPSPRVQRSGTSSSIAIAVAAPASNAAVATAAPAAVGIPSSAPLTPRGRLPSQGAGELRDVWEGAPRNVQSVRALLRGTAANTGERQGLRTLSHLVPEPSGLQQRALGCERDFEQLEAIAASTRHQRLADLLMEEDAIAKPVGIGKKFDARGTTVCCTTSQPGAATAVDRLCDRVREMQTAMRTSLLEHGGGSSVESGDSTVQLGALASSPAVSHHAEGAVATAGGISDLSRLEEMLHDLEAHVRSGMPHIEEIEVLDTRLGDLRAEVSELERQKSALERDIGLLLRQRQDLQDHIKTSYMQATCPAEVIASPMPTTVRVGQELLGGWISATGAPPLCGSLYAEQQGTLVPSAHSATHRISCIAGDDRGGGGTHVVLTVSAGARLPPHLASIAQPVPLGGSSRMDMSQAVLVTSPLPTHAFGTPVVPQVSTLFRTESPPRSPRPVVTARRSTLQPLRSPMR